MASRIRLKRIPVFDNVDRIGEIGEREEFEIVRGEQFPELDPFFYVVRAEH